LRFRYDCAQQLAPAEFARVDAILNSSFMTMRDWRSQRVSPNRREIVSALRLISAASNPEQGYIRRAGAEMALIVDKIPIPRVRPLNVRARPLTAEQIDAAHAYTNPATAGYHLAKLITGLSDDMLLLIGGDQITDDAILQCAVPDRARPILRALDDGYDGILDVPWGPPPEPVDEAAQANNDFASTLAALLRGRSTRVATDACRCRCEQGSNSSTPQGSLISATAPIKRATPRSSAATCFPPRQCALATTQLTTSVTSRTATSSSS